VRVFRVRFPLSVVVLTLCALGCVRPLRVNAIASIDNGAADAILLAMTNVVALADSATDVACTQGLQAQVPDQELLPLVFNREGEIQPLPGPRVIADRASLAAVLANPGVTTVDLIMFCEGAFRGFSGCAENPGDSFAVIRPTFSFPISPERLTRIEGTLWAHEYGHNMGLSHRNDDPRALMNASITDDTVELNAGECVQMALGPNPGVLPEEAIPASSAAPERPSVETLARGLHIHGMPFVTPAEVSGDAVDKLVAMLADPRERAHRANVVTLLGMLGGPREASLLMDFVASSRSGGLDWSAGRDLFAAMLGLGYLAHRSEDLPSLAFLEGATTERFWALESPEIARAMRQAAVAGLAVSGRAEAWRSLANLAEDLQNDWMRATLAEAMRSHARVAELGLADFLND